MNKMIMMIYGQNPIYAHYRLSPPLDGEENIVLRRWVHARGGMDRDVLPADANGQPQNGRWFFVNENTGEIRCRSNGMLPWRPLTHEEFYAL